MIIILNNFKFETDKSIKFKQTKQVNDIARLSDRQSNYSTVKILKTATNTRILEFLGNIGNETNIPYQRNTCNVIDSNTGQHIIYKGWATIKETNKYYNIYIYDGIVDFYKAIENKFISVIGLSDLNHVKNIDTIKATWTDETLPYRYNIADYNGQLEASIGVLNTDYQIPSVNIAWLFNKIMDFFGYEYEGAIFTNQKFVNSWLTYPKPVPTTEPSLEIIKTQTALPLTYVYNYYDGYAYLSNTKHNPYIFREEFTNSNANTVLATPIESSAQFINILQNGVYKLKVSGSYSNGNKVQWIKYSYGIIVDSGMLFLDGLNEVYFSLNVGDKITAKAEPPIGSEALDMNIFSEFSRVDGYVVNFESIFIDFEIKDFINEVMQRFSLTMFKDKYSNKLKFKTLSEVLQSTDILDLSNKFVKKLGEVYILDNYAKRNYLKYKYNDQNARYNDGFIDVENENLPDNKTIIQSNIYAHENYTSLFSNKVLNVYKIWDKEVKDDLTIKYKPLENRFYIQRSEKINEIINLKSVELNLTGSNSFYFKENNWRLSYFEIVADFYSIIKTILSTSKVVSVELWLKANEVSSINFERLVYFKEFQSYYLINKVNDWVESKPTKLELIEVDYISPVVIPIPTPDYLTIANSSILLCNVTLEIETSLPIGTQVTISIYQYDYGFLGNYNALPIQTPYVVTYLGSDLVVPIYSNVTAFYKIEIMAFNSIFETFTDVAYDLLVTGCPPLTPSCTITTLLFSLKTYIANYSLLGYSYFKFGINYDSTCPIKFLKIVFSNINGTSENQIFNYDFTGALVILDIDFVFTSMIVNTATIKFYHTDAQGVETQGNTINFVAP